jgi:hypothetical protein
MSRKTPLNAPIRLPSGEVTTLARLDDEKRLIWRESNSWSGAVTYFAELVGSRNGAACIGWTVGKLAFLSRTGESETITAQLT